MNAKETMQTLLDGQTIVVVWYGKKDCRLNPDSNQIEVRLHGEKEWLPAATYLNYDCKPYREYELSEDDAFFAILNGHVVSSEHSPDTMWRIRNRRVESACISGNGMFIPAKISKDDQDSMWKVVE